MKKQSITQRFQPLLAACKDQDLYRQLAVVSASQQSIMTINNQKVTNFSSNDYLGLANHPDIKEAIQQALRNGINTGSGAAHLITGHHLQHQILEEELADWLDVEAVLLFSTGYMANLAVQQALMHKGDLILGDKLNHASLIDGALQSEATFKRYSHLDMQSLERRLQANNSQDNACLITTDGVFSMDGEIAPLAEIKKLSQNYQAWYLIDDAHGLGVLGKHGKGSFEYFNCSQDSNSILMGTLGKAFGTSGAFVAGSQVLIETLINFARPYMYTTAMSPLMAVASRAALKCVINFEAEREHLFKLINTFKQGAASLGLKLIPSSSPIQVILLGESKVALKWSELLKKQGFWVVAIRPPTVTKNSSRLRITLSAAHSLEQVYKLLEALKRVKYPI